MIPSIDYQGALQDTDELKQALADFGMHPSWAFNKASSFAKAAGAVTDGLAGNAAAPLRAFFVPGRIEIVGKHTDYAGGSSLLAAAEQGFCLVAAPRRDGVVRITDVAKRELCQFAIDPEIAPRVGHWSNYPMTVARRIARNFPGAATGAEIAFASDLPTAAGMSSSSAMIVAFFLALADVNALWSMPRFQTHVPDRVQLAAYLATVENGQNFGRLEGDRGVGTAGGSEDHTAILCCRAATLSQYAYCPLRHELDLPMPEGYVCAIGTSGVVAEKTGGAMERYNRASRLAALAAEIWRAATGRDEPHLAAILRSDPGAVDRLRQLVRDHPVSDPAFTPEAILTRLEHFHLENEELLPAEVDSLGAGRLDDFGRLVDRSQQAAEDLLGNQIPETRFLAASARRHGAVAASAFGAGFGGSVWAMVARERVGGFLELWSTDYARQNFPHTAAAMFFPTVAGPPAFRVR